MNSPENQEHSPDHRQQFRRILRQVVNCIRSEKEFPGTAPLNASVIAHWLNQVTAEDIEAVWEEKDRKG